MENNQDANLPTVEAQTDTQMAEAEQPVAETSPEVSIVAENNETAAVLENASTQKEPTPVQAEPVQENAVQETSILQEPAQQESIQQETIQPEAIQPGASQREASKNKTVQPEVSQKEAIEVAIEKESINGAPVEELAREEITGDTVMTEVAESKPANESENSITEHSKPPSTELYDPLISFAATAKAPAKTFANPFIIDSEPEEAADPASEAQDPDISVFRTNDDDDDDDEYEPSAPILPKKPSNATEPSSFESKAAPSLPHTPQVATPEVYRMTPELPNVPNLPKTPNLPRTPEVAKPTGSLSGVPTGPAAMRNKKHKRLSLDTIGKIEDKLQYDPNNISLWQSLVDALKSKDKIVQLRETYEKMLEIFPISASIWVEYIDLELAHGEFLNVEKLFGRSLTTVYSVKLWQKYLEYVLRMNNIQTNGEKARTTIQQTYDFVLDKIGLDRESGIIWAQYIDFVRSKETPTTWEQQQQMDSLRKIYRKAICIPLNNVEYLWHAYNTFENGINKSTARKFVAEKSAIYMTARSSLRELQNITQGLDRSTKPKERRFVRSEEKQIEIWRNWIKWEEKNPLEATEKSIVSSRVTYVYKQAMMTMWFYPEIWFEAADYALHQETDGVKEALDILKMGMKANPTSALLCFKAAEVLEFSGQKEEAMNTCKSLLTNLKASYSKLEEKLTALKAEDETASPKATAIEKLMDTKAKDITHTYIAFMAIVRRMEGIAQARQIFGECRKLPYSTYHIYIASASMELRNDKPDIATKIFEIGLKRFSQNVEYIGEYIRFLIGINDDTNARALFEKSVSNMDPKDAKPLYKQFLDYEARFGELTSLKKLEDRYRVLYPGGNYFPILIDF